MYQSVKYILAVCNVGTGRLDGKYFIVVDIYIIYTHLYHIVLVKEH